MPSGRSLPSRNADTRKPLRRMLPAPRGQRPAKPRKRTTHMAEAILFGALVAIFLDRLAMLAISTGAK